MKGFFVISVLIAGLSSTAAVPAKSIDHTIEKRYLLVEATRSPNGQYVCPDGYNKVNNDECAINYVKIKRSPKNKDSDAKNDKNACPEGFFAWEGTCKPLIKKRALPDKIEISCPEGYVYSNGQCSPIR